MSSFDSTMNPASVRELAARESDGIEVRLLWDMSLDRLTLAIDDARTEEAYEISVRRDRALDAFHHPFAYLGSAIEAALPVHAEQVAV